MRNMIGLLIIMLAMSVTSVFAISEAPSTVYCNIHVGGQCVALNLPNNEQNTVFCRSLDGQSAPSGTFTTKITTASPENGCEDVTPAPEFGAIGAGIALIGSVGAYFRIKKAAKKA